MTCITNENDLYHESNCLPAAHWSRLPWARGWPRPRLLTALSSLLTPELLAPVCLHSHSSEMHYGSWEREAAEYVGEGIPIQGRSRSHSWEMHHDAKQNSWLASNSDLDRSHSICDNTDSHLKEKSFSLMKERRTCRIGDDFHGHCNTLQHTATHCNTRQHTATHCNTLQHTATHCNTLHNTATHGNTLQHTATHCNTLHCNTRGGPGGSATNSTGPLGCCWASRAAAVALHTSTRIN